MAATGPIAGSAYTHAYATMGELIAWIIGWDLILEYALGATTVAIGWSGYVVSFLKGLGIAVPSQYVSLRRLHMTRRTGPGRRLAGHVGDRRNLDNSRHRHSRIRASIT